MDWPRPLMRRLRLWLPGVWILAACGGQTPTAPRIGTSDLNPTNTGAAPMAGGTVLTFVSGENGAAAGGVDVVIGVNHERYRTDGSGQIRLSDNLTLPASLEAVSEEYLQRETVLRFDNGTSLTLWPRHSPTGLDEASTRRIVYTEAAGGAAGARPMHRVLPGRVSVVPDPALRADADAMAAHEAAAEALTAATKGEVEFVVEATPTSGMVVRTMVDASDPAMNGHAALTYRTVDGGVITGARVVFLSQDLAHLPAIVTHELGHSFGLEHSDDPTDLMYPVVSPGRTLSMRESLIIDLMLKRPPGNRFPDNDRDGGNGASRTVEVVACR
jgi:Matrixin